MALASHSLNAAVPVVTNVVAQQRVGTKLVDISYDVFDADGDRLKIRVEVSDNGGNLYSVPAFSLTGDIGESVVTGANKQIVWDAGVDWDGEYSDEMKVKVIAVDTIGFPGLEWGNEVPPGGFLMGQDGGVEGSGPSRHVNIPWSYWMSKYEIRNDQYCDFLNTALVADDIYRIGTSEVRSDIGRFPGVPGNARLIYIGDTKDIRWNVNNFEVVGGRSNYPVRVTWYGAMAFAQYYGYDLPTEAEWEKAARGPDHDDEDEHYAYPWGETIGGGYANYGSSGDPYSSWGPSPVGYFNGNQIPIGPNVATGYGLYDVAGNVEEWTRSTWLSTVENYPQEEAMTNDVNYISTSANRVYRGGSHGDTTARLMCYYRDFASTIDMDNSSQAGVRVVRRDLIYSDSIPTLTTTENFDGADWLAKTGAWTVVTTSGSWTGTSSTVFIRKNESIAFSSNGCIQISAPGYGSGYYVILPKTTNRLVGISLWCRAVSSGTTASLALQEYDGTTWRSTESVSISGISYRKERLNVVLTQPSSGQQFRLSGDSGVYIDNYEAFTVPE